MSKAVLIKECGIPVLDFSIKGKQAATIFELSSHQKAKEALDMGMEMRKGDSHVFLGIENQEDFLCSTADYVQAYLNTLPPPSDWVYLNNFKDPTKPLYYEFPAGRAVEFQKEMERALQNIILSLSKNFSDPNFIKKIKTTQQKAEEESQKSLDTLRKSALKAHLDIEKDTEGTLVIVLKTSTHTMPLEALSSRERQKLEPALKKIQAELIEFSQKEKNENEKLEKELEKIKNQHAKEVLSSCGSTLEKNFSSVPGILDWLKGFQENIISQLTLLIENPTLAESSLKNSYTVNIIATHNPALGPQVVVGTNLTYENLFGTLKYKIGVTGGETDFSMIKGGALHQANGSVLLLRAEDLALQPTLWHSLKRVLRDKRLEIRDPQNREGVPLMSTPHPQPIPLNIQIILVGSSQKYDSFFYKDNEFNTYFKIKAEVESTLPITPKNLRIVGSLLSQACTEKLKRKGEKSALNYVTGYGCRLANHREKITAHLEILTDILREAAVFARLKNRKSIKKLDVIEAIKSRHFRHSHFQNLAEKCVAENILLIKTRGDAIGQINGLTIHSIRGETFGCPARITARTYMGQQGILNIEHTAHLGDPIQYKGVLTLEGFLRGVFGQEFPLSFSCTLTFEQTYAQVDGDSATLAELIAILSSLAEVPIRQDIAVTGSLNQFGIVEAVGGVNEKIEAFYATCKDQGLTRTQGVIIPKINHINLVLSPPVSEAIKEGDFHVWGVNTVGEALELLTGVEVGEEIFHKEKEGTSTIFGKVNQKLKCFDEELRKNL